MGFAMDLELSAGCLEVSAGCLQVVFELPAGCPRVVLWLSAFVCVSRRFPYIYKEMDETRRKLDAFGERIEHFGGLWSGHPTGPISN